MSEPGTEAGAEEMVRRRVPSPFARGAAGSRPADREGLAASASDAARAREPEAAEREPEAERDPASERNPEPERERDLDPAAEHAAEPERDREPTAGAAAAGRVAGMPARRATIMAVLAAVLVLAVGVAVWSALEAQRLRDPGGNVALADDAATREVADQVSTGLKAIFSYDYNNLERTERAAGRVLVERAVGQYEASFAAASAQAREQRLVRTTTVRSIGVQELTGDEARVLALVDQQTLHPGDAGRQETTSAALAVVAKRVGGEWRIAALAGL